MNLQLVSNGNTEEKREGESWKFTCSEGDDQCSANILQACVIHLVKNISVQFPFIECMMTTSGLRENIAKSCALYLGGIDWAEIIGCSRGSLGREQEDQMVERTKALETSDDSYLPYVTVNGRLLDGITENPETDFVNVLCQNYQVNSPS